MADPQTLTPLTEAQKAQVEEEVNAQRNDLRTGNEPEDPDVKGDEALHKEKGAVESFTTGFGIGREVDAIGPAILDAMDTEDPDSGWSASKQKWEEETEGIPTEYMDEMTDVRSEAELEAKSKRIRKELKLNSEMSELGWSGLSGRLLAGVLDETALTAAVASEGVMAPAVFTAKAGRMSRAVRAATVGGSTEAALEATTLESRPTKGMSDVLGAAAFGAALTAPWGAFSKRGTDKMFAEGARKVHNQVDNNQAAEMLREAAEEHRQRGLGDFDEKIAEMETEAQRLESEAVRLEGERQQLDEADPVSDFIRQLDEADGTQRAADEVPGDAGSRLDEIARKMDTEAGRKKAREVTGKEPPSKGTVRRVRQDADEPETPDEPDTAMAQAFRDASRESENTAQVAEAFKRSPSGTDEVTDEARAFARSAVGTVSGQKRNNSRAKQAEVDTTRQAQAGADTELENLRKERQALKDAPNETVQQSVSKLADTIQGDAQAAPDIQSQQPGQGSVGAAESGGLTSEGRTFQPTGIPDDQDPSEITGLAGLPRMDQFGRVVKNTKSDTIRHLAQLIIADSVGPPRGSGRAANRSAAEIKDQIVTARLGLAISTADAQWKKYVSRFAGTQGRNKFTMQFDDDARSAFMHDVARYMEHGGDDVAPEVSAVANEFATQQRKILQDAKDVGLLGFDEIPENAAFLTRMVNSSKMVQLEETLGLDKGDLEGLVREAILRSDAMDEEMSADLELATEMANAWVRRFRNRGYGIDNDTHMAFSGRDPEAGAAILREEGVDEAVIDRYMKHFKQQSDAEGEGGLSFSKHRIPMDTSTRIRTESGVDIGIEDILEMDAEHLFGEYTRRMGGEIALAQKFREDGVEVPVSPSREWAKRMKEARQEGATDEEISALEQSYRQIIGKPPLEGMNSGLAVALRLLRDFNFLRFMGQVGFAVPAEWGMAVGQLGVRAMARNMPDLKRMAQRGENGRVDHPQAYEMDEVGSVMGMEHVMFRRQFRMDDDGLEAKNPWLSNLEGKLEKGKQAMAMMSGLRPLTNGLQRMTAVTLSQRFMKMAREVPRDADGRIRLADRDRERIRNAGLSDEMLDRAIRQMDAKKRNVKSPETGKDYETMGLEDWANDVNGVEADVEAREALMGAIHKWTNRIAQRNFEGELPTFMNSPLFAAMFRFRSFVFTALQKQGYHGANQRDMYTFASFMGSTFFAGMSYTAQQMINSVGEADQDKFLKERLSVKNIALSSFQRSSWASIVPGVLDTALTTTPFMDESAFPHGRTSGLATSFVGGIPAVQMGDDMVRTAKGMMSAPTRSDYDFSREDFRALSGMAPFSNMMGLRNALKLMEQELPQSSIDDDDKITFQ